jgi:hypothetical protein
MAKYDPLGRHLKRSKSAVLELSFSDIERIIGAMLPNSASLPQWWENETAERGHVQCRAWREAGYDAFLLKGKDTVVFRRRQET